MEAEAGSPNNRITEAVDHNRNSGPTVELELQKLPALVQNLELQNQQLRSRRNRTPSGKLDNNNNNDDNNNDNTPGLPFGRVGDGVVAITVLDDVEELDLDGMFSKDSDEETWLYVPSRVGARVDRHPLSPFTWWRAVPDRPVSVAVPRTPHLQPASPLLLSPWCSLNTVLEASIPPAERSPAFLPHLANRGRHSGLSDDDDKRDTIAMDYKLQDLTDVQVMARLQEDSLRLDCAWLAPRRKRRRSPSAGRPHHTLEDEVVDRDLPSPPEC